MTYIYFRPLLTSQVLCYKIRDNSKDIKLYLWGIPKGKPSFSVSSIL